MLSPRAYDLCSHSAGYGFHLLEWELIQLGSCWLLLCYSCLDCVSEPILRRVILCFSNRVLLLILKDNQPALTVFCNFGSLWTLTGQQLQKKQPIPGTWLFVSLWWLVRVLLSRYRVTLNLLISVSFSVLPLICVYMR